MRRASLDGYDIAVIVVRPVIAGAECLVVLHNGDERLLLRTPGHMGQVDTVKGRHAISAVETSRHPDSPEQFSLWERFQKRAEEGGTEDEDLEAAIAASHRKFRDKVADLLMDFTPLDAVENLIADAYDKSFKVPVPRNVFEPEVIEILPDYIRDDFFNEDDFENHDDCENDKPQDHPARRGGLFELLGAESRAVVLGEPGGGKTTCLRRLALDATINYQPGAPVTLYIPLSRWQAAGGFWSLIRYCTGLSPGQVERLIAAGRCRLLLDALNECPDALRATAVNAIAALLREHPALPVVITARTPDSTIPFRLPTFTVEPLSGDQQSAFLRAYLRDPEQADQLLERIRTQPGGENLASNPLLLRMIVEVARQGGDLPAGRAGLYRRWVGDWHKRESAKADTAGDPLPWDFDNTRRGLAAIALISRRQGIRFADDELATESLVGIVEDPDGFLERMTQGPLILRDEGRLEFRHETFQEYLCAEALLANPGAVDSNDISDKTTWGMVIVQAAQLGPLPEPLADAAWAMDPWLGAGLSPREALPRTVEKQKTLWSAHAYEALLFLNGGYPPPASTQSALEAGWYNKADPVIRAAVFSVPEVKERWLEFETNLLRNVLSQDLLVLDYLTQAIGAPYELVARVDVHFKDRLLTHSGPICAHGLCDLGVFDAEDFGGRRQEWISQATPNEVIACVREKLFSLTGKDFASRRAELAAEVDPGQAAHLVWTRICTSEDFASRRAELADKADPGQATRLVSAKICVSRDFAERRKELAVEADPEQAGHLVRTGICGAEDFAERRVDLAAEANPGQAGHLVRQRICTPEDFSDRRGELAAKANPGEEGHLVDTNICTPEDFSRRRAERAAEADLNHAMALVEAGLSEALLEAEPCTAEGFAALVDKSVKRSTLKDVKG